LGINHIVPANDDSVRSVSCILNYMKDAILLGLKESITVWKK
jgi:ribosomal protein S2